MSKKVKEMSILLLISMPQANVAGLSSKDIPLDEKTAVKEYIEKNAEIASLEKNSQMSRDVATIISAIGELKMDKN